MTARLIPTRVPKQPRAAVIVLHGGGARRAAMRVSPTQLSVLRMIPIARGIARAGRGEVAVFRLLNSVRGWDTKHTPVDDVHWALAQLRDQLPTDTPVGLVGHSLGGRAALLAVGEDDVRSVVALAPWVQPHDGAIAGKGRDVLIVHGTADRIADPRRSAAAAERLRRSARVTYVRVGGAKHAMLRRHDIFSRLASEFTLAVLLDRETGDPLLRRARAGSTIDA